MHRAKVAWSSEDVADEYELQLQHELEMLQVTPDSTSTAVHSRPDGSEFDFIGIFSKNFAFWRMRERQSINSANFK